MTRIENFLTQQDIDAYLVGGYVRDALLMRATKDVDIAVATNALEVARRIADTLDGAYVPLDKEKGIARVVLSEPREGSLVRWHLDFSTIQEGIEADLSQRDFTINAMAVNLRGLRETEVIDPFQGMKDLRQGRIRVVKESAFESDPARLLRAVRLAAEYGLTIEEQTESLIQSQACLLQRVAGERVQEELSYLLSLPRAAPLLLYLDRLGLLTVIFPELAQTKGVEQPQEHFWDVFHHSIQTVAAVEQLLRIDESVNKEVVEVAPWSPKLAQHFEDEIGNVKRSTLVKLAALLHDIAKPKTKSIERDGRVHFLGHAKEGAAMVGNILGRLRFSTPQIRAVQRMVEHHLRLWQMSNIPSQIFDLAGGSGSPQNLRFCGDKNEGLPTRRAIYRYFRDTGDVAIDIVWLSLADYLATRGPNLDLQEWEKHAQLMDYIMSEYEKEESIVSPPKLISGHDLIDLFGMQPGPKIGEILEAVREAQGMGEIKTREEALAFVSRQICSLH